MLNDAVQVVKDCGQPNPWESFLNKIVLVRPRYGHDFSSKLVQIRGDHLVFENRAGLKTIIHVDAIYGIFEVNRLAKRVI